MRYIGVIVKQMKERQLAGLKRGDKERFKKLDYPFPGTMVTIGFNLHDNSIYYLNSEKYEAIQF